MSDRNARTDLADPSAALVSYLDDLLHTATSTASDSIDNEPGQPPAAEAASPAVTETRALTDEALVPEMPAENEEPEAAKPAPAPAALQTPRDRAIAVAAEEPRQQPPAPQEAEANPDWADRPFECLIFKVAGLQLAVPLVLLGAIHRIDEKIKPIPGRPPWYMGMLLDRNQKLKVVDSAEWIMSGRVPAGARDGYRFVIRLDDSDWALACDEVAESFTLDPDQVRWRTSRSKRPWLAGTVVKHMCALIDVGEMARLLARAEREHHLELE